jgi:hypothetical protein
MRVLFSVPRIRSACAVGLLLLSQLAARSQAAPQNQAPVQDTPAKPPTLRQTSLPDALVGVPFHASVQAADGYGEVVMTLHGNLPAGLTMQTGAKTFAISGVPEEFGTFDLDIAATDSYGQTARGSFMMRILPRPLVTPPAAVIPDAETIHTADADLVFFPAVIRDTETISTTDTDKVFMPVIINVKESISATDADNDFFPAMIADHETITAADADVLTAKVGILPSTTPSGTYNAAYSQTFTAAGNTGAVTLTPSGTIPGLSFSTSGTSSTTTLSGTPSTAGTYTFTITAKDTVNTDVVSYTLVINKASQSITVGTLPSPVYGGATFTLSATASPSGLAVTITSTSALATGTGPFTPAGAGSATFQATQAGNANYAAASPVNFNVSIAQATLNVKATNASRTFGQPNPSFSYSFGTFVNGDTAGVVSGAPTFAATATPLSPVSGNPYAITITQGTLSATNYTFSFTNGALTVLPAAQTITFYPLPTLSNGATFPLSARASSGLAVTYGVSGPASITNNVLSVTGSGLVKVTAGQTGNGNYNAATSVVRSFTAP